MSWGRVEAFWGVWYEENFSVNNSVDMGLLLRVRMAEGDLLFWK